MLPLAIAALAVLLAVSALNHDLGGLILSNAESTLLTETRNRLQAAGRLVAAESVNSDGDEVPEVVAPRAAQAGEPSPPAAGGYVPLTSGAPKTDAYGTPLALCGWDHGSVTGAAGLLTGVTAADPLALNAAAYLAVISAGPDRVFATSCAQAGGGVAAGDDRVFQQSVAEGLVLAQIWRPTGTGQIVYGTGTPASQVLIGKTSGTAQVDVAQNANIDGSLTVGGSITGGSLALTGGPLPVAQGGTGAASGGAALDNLLGSAAVGLVTRTGSQAYALRSLVAGSGGVSIVNGSGTGGNLQISIPTPGGDLGGSTLAGAIVGGLRGTPVSAAAPGTGQVLAYTGSAWAPTTVTAQGGGGGVTITELDTLQTVVARGSTTSGSITAAGYYYSSDPRLKTGMVRLGTDEARAILAGIDGWRYLRLATGAAEIGFNADQVAAVAPELVSTDGAGYRAVAYGNLVPVLLEVVKDQQRRIDRAETLLWVMGGVLALGGAAVGWRRSAAGYRFTTCS